MRILMVLSTKKFPPDIRVQKEARVLLSAGHQVFLVARRGPGQAPFEDVEGVQVLRVWLPFQQIKPLSDLVYFTLQRYWIVVTLLRFIYKFQIDALHVHDLPYALATLVAGKLASKPVVFDMHENYTEMIIGGIERTAIYNFILLLMRIMSLEERIVCSYVDRVIIVAREHRTRVASLGAPEDSIITIPNAADISQLDRVRDAMEQQVRPIDSTFRVSYVGGFGKSRGIDYLIRAVALLKDLDVMMSLVLVGDGGSSNIVSHLKRLAKSLGVEQQVEFTGWLPFPEAMRHILQSDLCAVPYRDTPQTRSGIPHKLFQYMYLERPVLVSSVPAHRRVVEEGRAGISFESGNVQDLADKLYWASQHPDELIEMGHRGHRLVKEVYNWKTVGERLNVMYESLGEPLG